MSYCVCKWFNLMQIVDYVSYDGITNVIHAIHNDESEEAVAVGNHDNSNSQILFTPSEWC